MRTRLEQALLISMMVFLSACGVVKRAALHGLIAVQSGAVLTQGEFKDPQEPERRHKPCDGMRSARLNLADAFSQATSSDSSTTASSSKIARTLAKSSSVTSRPVIVMLSAYSSDKPGALPRAALRSCQNPQPFKKATRRLIIAVSFPSMSPEASSPLHMPRMARKIDGRRA